MTEGHSPPLPATAPPARRQRRGLAWIRASTGLLHVLTAASCAAVSLWVGSRRSRRSFRHALQEHGLAPEAVARLSEEYQRAVRLPDWQARARELEARQAAQG